MPKPEMMIDVDTKNSPITCEVCSKPIPIGTDHWYCWTCHAVKCQECCGGEKDPICAHIGKVECSNCGEMVDEDSRYEIRGSIFCDECAESLFPGPNKK